jgi:hypothetical protein
MALVDDVMGVPVAVERGALLVAGQDVGDGCRPHDDASFGGVLQV